MQPSNLFIQDLFSLCLLQRKETKQTSSQSFLQFDAKTLCSVGKDENQVKLEGKNSNNQTKWQLIDPMTSHLCVTWQTSVLNGS